MLGVIGFPSFVRGRREGGTKYTAIAIHKDQADRKKHEEMGFHEGWACGREPGTGRAERESITAMAEYEVLRPWAKRRG